MTSLIYGDTSRLNAVLLRDGAELVKRGDDTVPSYSLSGVFQVTKDGWAVLSVPNALVRGVFAAIDEPGVELPPLIGGGLFAHITVFRPEEIKTLGGQERLTERGKRFHYRLGGLVTAEPAGWPEMSKVWMLRVHSPELQSLRRSYGLSSLPNQGQFDFHCTVAVRRKGVLGRNERRKNTEVT